MVEDLAFGYLKDTHPLVIDRTALARVGVSPVTVLSIPRRAVVRPGSPVRNSHPTEDLSGPWDEVGLVLLRTRSGCC